ncbi:MAG: 16S rRNA (cytidine(1402)-2'-O)-methyltransferase [SAR202 cluster bacterium]|jgi:16S rRNA (cytidine1402-2'-O)-methyltransferase|nr:16S rRNA (cytidine(1402)-2'-O)-methyltransferase [SAR202 cluster bacterium]
MPSLYVVGTPIGNMEDMSARALRVLGDVAVIATEDTRTTRKLLTHYEIHTRLLSFQEHNAAARIPQLLGILEEGDVALVTEAGTPGVSDPGASLVAAAGEHGVPVVSIPGPSSVTAAVSISGFPGERFNFIGFLPRRKGDRKRLFESLSTEPQTIVALESPHRVVASLADMLEVWGERRIAVCRELTKVHEEVFRGTLQAAVDYFQEPRGEFTLVIEGATSKLPVDTEATRITAKEELLRLRSQGLGAKEAVAQVVKATRMPRKVVYSLWLENQA